jgi:hypothetical protein
MERLTKRKVLGLLRLALAMLSQAESEIEVLKVQLKRAGHGKN